MTQVAIRSIYDGADKSIKVKSGTSRTQQNFRDECDINHIMAKYEKTGFLVDPLHAATRTPLFGDFTAIPDFQTAQNIIREGVEIFEALPARIRKIFDNDPAVFSEFMSNRDNLDSALEMGLVDEHYVDVIKAQEAAVVEEKTSRNLKVIPKDEENPVTD